MRRLFNFSTGKGLTLSSDGNATLDIATGKYFSFGGKRVYFFTTAITANTTTTTAPAGSFAVTTNATGLSSIFVSDGAKWQFLTNA